MNFAVAVDAGCVVLNLVIGIDALVKDRPLAAAISLATAAFCVCMAAICWGM